MHSAHAQRRPYPFGERCWTLLKDLSRRLHSTSRLFFIRTWLCRPLIILLSHFTSASILVLGSCIFNLLGIGPRHSSPRVVVGYLGFACLLIEKCSIFCPASGQLQGGRVTVQTIPGHSRESSRTRSPRRCSVSQRPGVHVEGAGESTRKSGEMLESRCKADGT